MLRYFANRYAEQTDLDEVDTWGVPEYIDWVLKAGNPLRIAADYFVMVWSWTNARIGFPHLVVEDGVAELRYWKDGPVPAEAREEPQEPQAAPLPIPA